MNAHFFNIETLIKVNSRPWIVDKNNPSNPIFKLSKWDFNLIKSGIYKKQGNLLQFSDNEYWFPTEMWNKIKVMCKKENVNITDLAVSLREYMDGEIIKELDTEINLDNIKHLRNTGDDIYIICSRNTKEVYSELISKLEEKLSEIGLKVKDYYYISDTFLSRDKDGIAYTKVKLILQHLMGRRSDKDKFTDEQITMYNQCNIYEDDITALKLFKDANNVFKFLMDNTKSLSNSLYLELKERVDELDPSIVINEVTPNRLNKFKKSEVVLTYDKIKTFESFNSTFILESVEKERPQLPIVWSKEFGDVISKLSNNPIARELNYTIEGDGRYLYDFSFLDLTDKDDFISFIQSNRVYKKYENDIKDLEKYEKINFLMKNAKDWAYKNNRTEISIGKFARKIFGGEFTDREIEDFVNKWKREILVKRDPLSALELVSGEDIRYWYDESHYYNGSGSLGDSCMRYDECQSFLKIYSHNPEVCNLLIMKKDDKLVGRALVWKTEGSSEFNFMDRIYYNHSKIENLFMSYADKHNMMIRTGRTNLIGSNGSKLDLYKDEIIVKVKPIEYNEYPYMDTLFFYDSGKGILTNIWSHGLDYLRFTDGEYMSSDDIIFSNKDQCFYSLDESVYVEDLEDYIHTSDSIYIEYLGVYYYKDNDNIVKDNNREWVLRDDCYYSNELDVYILKEYATKLYNSNSELDYFPEGAKTFELDGKDYYIDSVILNPLDKKYYPKSSLDLDKIREYYYNKYNVSGRYNMEDVIKNLKVKWILENKKELIKDLIPKIEKYIIANKDDSDYVDVWDNIKDKLDIAAAHILLNESDDNLFGRHKSWFISYIRSDYNMYNATEVNSEEIKIIKNLFKI